MTTRLTQAPSEIELSGALRELASRVPGVWTVGQLRKSLIETGALTETDTDGRLRFELSCLVASGEAEVLGFDSYRIYLHASE